MSRFEHVVGVGDKHEFNGGICLFQPLRIRVAHLKILQSLHDEHWLARSSPGHQSNGGTAPSAKVLSNRARRRSRSAI